MGVGRLRKAAAALLLLIAPLGAAAQTESAEGQRQILREAGIAFPERLGSFRLLGTSSVQAGRVGAQYGGPGDAIADIFISRVAQPLESEFASTEAMIGQVFANLRPVRDLAAPTSAPGARGRLWTGESGGRPAYTAMMLWHRGGWRIKMRVTVDASAGEAGIAEIERFIHAFDWSGEGRPQARNQNRHLNVRLAA